MSEIWQSLIECQNKIIEIFDREFEEYTENEMTHFNRRNWVNRVWKDECVRRAHIDVVDARESKGLWMMHVCLFPVLSSDAPIFGFDVIAGKNKITGAFLDFSHTVNSEHYMIRDYKELVKDFVPTKKRELPEWAQNIFSSHMIAASNINTVEESREIIDLAIRALECYVKGICTYPGFADDEITAKAQNFYCENQNKNPHTPRVMKSLGLDENDVDKFCKDILFPRV